MPAESSNLPPYVSFGVFKSTIEALRDNTVPSGPLDRRVLHDLSGADYGALMSGLRFLGLIDEERKANVDYRALVQASKDDKIFKDALFALIAERYKPIVGELDFESGTAAEFEKAFRAAGVSAGQMLTKSVRFYVKALQESGKAVSTFITKPKPRAPRNTTPRSKKEATEGNNQTNGGIRGGTPEVLSDTPPSGYARMPIPGITNGFVQYPTGLTDAQCEMYSAVVTLLRTYVKGLGGREEKR